MLNLVITLFCFKAIRKSLRIWVVLFFFPIYIFAQDSKKTKGKGNPVPAFFTSLQKQAEYYYGLRKGREADSIINKMILYAEQSMDPVLLKTALFENPAFTSDIYFSLDGAAKSKGYIDRALVYARRINQPDLIAFAYIKLAGYHLANGDLEKADYNVNISYSNAMSSGNDTAIVKSLVQQGIVNQAMSKSLIALRIFYNALDLAQEKKLSWLETEVYRALAPVYKKLRKRDEGRELIYKSIGISKGTGNRMALMYDYLILAHMCVDEDLDCQREALREAMRLSDSLGIKSAEMEARRFLFYTYLANASSDSMVSMLNRDTELKDYLKNVSPGTLDWTLGQVYLYGSGKNDPDSALHYMLKAADPVYMNSVMIRKKNFITELAMSYAKKDINKAIETYSSLLNMEQQTSNFKGMLDASDALKRLYDQQADYKMAYHYNKLYDSYAGKISEQAREDDMALMMMDNERKEKQRIEKQELLQKNQYFNLQYTLIAILIFTLFIGLAMMGLYKVSQRTVRLLGFFSFLLLFEYITLMSKKWISGITGGTPWQDFLFMILVALVMLPLHNWLEHQIIGYLISKELLKPHKDQKKEPQPESGSHDGEELEKEDEPVRNIIS